jgi:flagellar motor protein MotB
MSVVHDELKDSKDSGGKWFLRKSDSDVFGPEELSAIARWVEESRVVSGNRISQDKKTWTAVEDIPDFEMDWIAELPDGRKYGPFNIKASDDLRKHKVLPPEAVLVNRHSKDRTTVEDYLAGQFEVQKAKEEPKDAKQEADAAPKTADTTEKTAPEEDKDTPPVKKKKEKRSRKTTSKAAREEGDEKPVDAASDEKAVGTTEDQEEEGPSSQVAEEVTKLNSQLAKSQKLVKNLKNELASLESANAEQLKDLQKAQTEAEATSKKLAGRQHESTGRQAENQEARKKIEEKFERKLKRREEKLSELGRLNEEAAEKASQAEERLAAALAELKKARKEGVSAQSNLKDVQAHQSRKQSVQQKRLSDLLEERNHLAQVVELQSRQSGRLRFIVIVLIVLSLAGIISLLVRRGKDDSSTSSGKPLEEQLNLEEDAPGSEVEAGVPATGRRRVPFPIIKSQGIEIFYNKSGCNLVFKDAFFSSGTSPSPSALAVIKKIAPQMRRYSNQYHLIVEGHTDNRSLGARSKYKSNYELGMARAKVVANLLTKDYGFTKSAVKAASAGSEDPPFSNDEDASRQKNMTVVLKLVRHVRI